MWGQIAEILIWKAAGGVDVRLIIDDLGSMRLFTNRYINHFWLSLNFYTLEFRYTIIPV